MESLNLLHSGLLAGIQKLIKNSSISVSEQEHLLELFKNEDSELLKIEQNSGNVEEVELQLIKLVRSWHKPEALIINTPKDCEETTSPLGNFLHEKKKRQHAEHELKLSVSITEYDSIKETSEDH